MENLEKRIKKFMGNGNEYGYGKGYGGGYGKGYGGGDGSGDGGGDGRGYGDYDGSGYGYGYGDGRSNGSGDGSGKGSGDGDYDGSGYGSGECNDYAYYYDDIKSYNNKKIYEIDRLPTIIYSIHKNIAKGAIVHDDLTLSECYIVKREGKFAHGETVKEASEEVEAKVFEELNTGEAIKEFMQKFPEHENKKYKAKDFFVWHHILTGSCEMGRKEFAKNHGINIEKDKFTVKEFVELTRDSYSGSVIKELDKRYMKREKE